MTTPHTPRTVNAGSVAAIFTALLAAIFAFQLNASMLSPVLATIKDELDTTDAAVGVTQTAFFTSAALFSLIIPRWGDLIGRKKLMIAMTAITVAGSVLAALSPSIEILFAARVIQGISGPIVPMALIMLRARVRDRKQFALLMAILTSINGGIAGVDALLGGWLAAAFGYHSVFWAMAVVAAVATALVALLAQDSRGTEQLPMDWPGAAAIVVALGAVLVAFNELGKLGAANWLMIAGLLLVGAIAFAIFWRIESTSPHPLVPTRYLRERRTWALLSTTVLTMTGIFAVMNGLVPNMGQDPTFGGMGADSISWVTLTPYALAGLLMGPVAGRLAGRFGYLAVLRAGLGISLVGILAALLLVGSTTPILLLLVSVWLGVSYAGMSNIMLNGLGVVLSPRENAGYLPGMNSGAFNIGAGLSFALLFAMQTMFSDGGESAAAGYSAGLITGAVVVAAALGVSFLIPRPAIDQEDDSEPLADASPAGTEGA